MKLRYLLISPFVFGEEPPGLRLGWVIGASALVDFKLTWEEK